MNKANFTYFLPLIVILSIIVSCTPAKMVLDVPEQVSNEAVKIKVSGVKGKGFPGSKRKLKFEREFSGEFKDGWKVSSAINGKTPGGLFSEEAARRSLLLNLGININEVTSKSTDKYQFKLSDSNNSVIVACRQQYLGKSTSYDINQVSYSVANRQMSTFAASILLSDNSEVTEWFLGLTYDRETPGGAIATALREGMAIENGFVTNKTDTIFIKPLFIKRNAEKLPDNSLFKSFEIVGGYEFTLKNKVIGIVDSFNPSVWLLGNPDTKHKMIVAATSTALLLRGR